MSVVTTSLRSAVDKGWPYRLPWLTMGAFNASAKTHRRRTDTKMVALKGVWPELHRRMRIAAAEEGMSYARLIDLLLDQRDARRKRQAAAQVSPLHRARTGTDLDGDPVTL